VDRALEDVQAQLRLLEQTHEESGRRLQQLSQMVTPSAEQREETAVLSNSLRMLGLQIRRLRLELLKQNGSAQSR
jgi:hypothetical protein